MSIWFQQPAPTVAELNTLRSERETVLDLLDIRITGLGDDYLQMSMPVDSRHVQPFGLLHGGVSVVLAESAASMAATLCIDLTRQRAVGIEINANHLRSVRPGDGAVMATASPVHLGRTSHVWRVAIRNEQDQGVCESRMTARILDLRP